MAQQLQSVAVLALSNQGVDSVLPWIMACGRWRILLGRHRVDPLPSRLPINGQSCRRIEVLAGPKRRRCGWEEKARIGAESLALDAMANAIAVSRRVPGNQPARRDVCFRDPRASRYTS